MIRQSSRFTGLTRMVLSFMLIISLCVTGLTPVFAAGEGDSSEEPEGEQTLDIAQAVVNGVDSIYIYDGSEKTPAYEVVYTKEDGTEVTLSEEVDFSVSYTDSNGQAATPVEAGSYQLVITGKGDYTGTKIVPFKIIKRGWIQDSNGWQWYDANGEAVRDAWIKPGDKWYYMKPDSYMAADEWAKDSKGWCWMDSDGEITTSAWIQDGGEWYYLKPNGYMAANEWAKDSKGWMWMQGNGTIAKDKWVQPGGVWYYLKPNGYMAANEWTKDSKGWMWMGSNGKITRKTWLKYKGYWYYLQANGYMMTLNWVKDSTGWMYMDANGRVTKGRWIQSNGNWYYMKANGYMATLQWAKDSHGWTYLDVSGHIVKDKWFKQNGNWYYVKSNGYMRTEPYVFISIGEQTLYYYNNGVCKLKTPVVTGKLYGTKYHGTPTGNYKVLSKQRNTHLKGLEDDGVTKYDSFVSYWMPFRGDGYGMHDASWRGSFGGTIYKYYGSHGCVNMPVGAAGTLYNLVTVGTMVHIQQ